ncbi:MmcQ/YjbR family DNA-binding protein [Georgenia yuyongxinii]|uniref:MmcQ/YjbR family DNA-binding protein n=1 Tax=Georgenia yuyongxinii TaxID=2589797 RepID=A0A552WP41_9MICO|nr:MmcQ/YjbR family DNA-binding protein [Georgenia yuyongxinii]QDC24440.1 MmcQ/YjbR family DNA-binding protein [Georgenia yuyongxinii]TRW44359.1 MmcQ/YjbR family DNA-binding protein [Georgenia yuyongxinii]
MAHPTMFHDADPYLALLRTIALAFPEAEEVVSHGRPNFRVRKVFAVYGSGTKGPAATRVRYDHGLVVLPEESERPALVQDPRYFVPAYLAPSGWIGVDLTARGRDGPDDVDWDEVAELLDGSYRQVAGPRLVTRLDAEGGPAAHRRR